MATETFDKSFFITNPKAIKKVIDIIESEPVEDNPSEEISVQEEIKQSEKILDHGKSIGSNAKKDLDTINHAVKYY